MATTKTRTGRRASPRASIGESLDGVVTVDKDLRPKTHDTRQNRAQPARTQNARDANVANSRREKPPTKVGKRRRRRTARSQLSDYEVRFTVGRPMIRDEAGEYILEIDGEIVVEEEGGAAVRAGSIRAYLLEGSRAINDGQSLEDTCDEHSVELAEVHALVYDEDGIKGSISDGCGGNDVLFVATIVVLPAHRGRRLGHIALQRTIDTFGTRTAVVLLKPYPLQFQHQSVRSETWREEQRIDAFDRDQPRATARLAAYWSEVGFQAIGGPVVHPTSVWTPPPMAIDPSEWFIRDMQRAGPTLDTFVDDDA